MKTTEVEKEIDVKLVREIEKFMYHLELRENTPPFPDEYIDDTTFYKIALHFYELGQKDAASKFDEIEYNRQRAEKEMFDKTLDEAADEYAYNVYPSEGVANIEICDAFKRGAAWQKAQMMKEAVEADVDTYRDLATGKNLAELVVKMPTNNLGDKVKIIIVKEEENK